MSIENNKLCYLGNDKMCNMGVIIINGELFRKLPDYTDLIEHFDGISEEALQISMTNYNKSQYLCIVDLKKTLMKNIDIKFFRDLVKDLQDKYPDKLYKCIIRNTPIFFKLVYNVLRPLIPKETRNKIFFEKIVKKNKTLTNEVPLE